MSYIPKNKIRIVTSASLFDGHDAAINIMRRIMQASGAEIIHLGHNRSVAEIVDTAIQEDVQGIAITSYQGGHLEFFKYVYDLLIERGAPNIVIVGGGGGTILPSEIKELEDYGIAKIYSPDDGRRMGLQGMIDDVLQRYDFPVGNARMNSEIEKAKSRDAHSIARLITAAENYPEQNADWLKKIVTKNQKDQPTNRPTDQPTNLVLGITGTGGSGKSSLADELVRRFLRQYTDKTIAIISVDPSKRKTGGALLGDRIRMNSIYNPRVFMRSLATRQSNLALSKHVQSAIDIVKYAGFDLIILETSGIGQSDTEITEHADVSLYVMTPEFGAATQLEKIDMLDFADVIAINKFDKRGALDALRDVKKQYQRNHNAWNKNLDEMPVFGTMASQFNDVGTNQLFDYIIGLLHFGQPHIGQPQGLPLPSSTINRQPSTVNQFIIPPHRTRYLSEITETIRRYDEQTIKQSEVASKLYALHSVINNLAESELLSPLQKIYSETEKQLDNDNKTVLENWEAKKKAYAAEKFVYQVRGKNISVPTERTTLSGNKIRRVLLPKYKDWGDILKWSRQENVPGEFPYTAGVFPFKREGEDPTRMFAGEGNPERTNRRFHYLSQNMPAHRLSTAFDSVTLYGNDPDHRPDIYGKVGNSGVSVCCLDDAKKLYSGFDLCDPKTSVSMTINGPAAIITAFFMNAAIDQTCEKYIRANHLEHLVEQKKKEIFTSVDGGWLTVDGSLQSSTINRQPSTINHPKYLGDLPETNNGLGLMLLGITGDQVLSKEIYAELKAKAIASVRGTVQADILKEDQAQNTCIFSTEFSLRLMGDMQQYFIDNNIRNFYSVSISGYHIAEAGANPISQLAFTLANGFTFVEYYVSRGMNIDAFAPNLSFFFSNGVDPEYAVIGRVARKIWAKAMKYLYNANERSQQLKYHIQTSGRSLHAQEISFNDIRTTLQALYAIYDNCNSLHTNAYDEAITTPTEESVRRAVAIQLIINHELGLTKNENPLQGAFIIEELTDLVETEVLKEFDRITERGGVLGAMETMYQRNKIQEESMHYEMQKHTGELPIIGVNTFLNSEGSPTVLPREVIRATVDDKENQIRTRDLIHSHFAKQSEMALKNLQAVAIKNENTFESLIETVKFCTLGQITDALYEVGGQYRRNM